MFEITRDDLRDHDLGICLDCGAHQGGVESDAEDYLCESCGERSVWGIEGAWFCGKLNVKREPQ